MKDKFTTAGPTVRQVRAIQALHQGKATAGQQKTALSWILYRAAMTTAETFVPGDPYATAYMAGRRSVGLQIVDALEAKVKEDGETET